MSKKIDNILYNILLENGILDVQKLESLKAEIGTENGRLLITELDSRGIKSENDILSLLSKTLGIEYRSVRGEVIDPALFKKIPVKIASHYAFVPISLEDNVLTIGVSYPMDIRVLDEIRFQLGYNIEQVVANSEEIEELLRTYYGFGAETIDKMFLEGKGAKVDEKKKIDFIEKTQEDATIANLVNQIILDAHKKRATDIHIEPYRGKVRFRYRIDGVLYDANLSHDVKHFISAILSRIKIMANLDIVEHRLPQDGQAVVSTKSGRLDLRVSFIPTPHGESVVIRILPAVVLYDFEKLGLLEEDRKKLLELLKRPNGIIFVTGPTGSGKTTTLYACLSKLNSKEKKIITIEDPIEYEMSGITQIQVHPTLGLTFAAGLRSMLRHDPDIMMVGEVRDLETAEIAVRVALTGHLVFSTVHTNSAASSIHRLMDIGIEPYLIQSSVIAFIAQRLVRVLCKSCKKKSEKLSPEIEKLVRTTCNINSSKEIVTYKAVGCDKCNNTGFYGRTAIYETLFVNDLIKDLIQKQATTREIEDAAMSHGMQTLIQSGLGRVVDGTTTIDEILNILSLRTNVSLNVNRNYKKEHSKIEPEEKEDVDDAAADRRIYQRLKTPFPIRFSIHDKITDDLREKMKFAGIPESDYEKEHTAVTDNISAGGLIFKYDLPLQEGTVLDMKLSIPVDPGRPPNEIVCLAKVIRVEKSGRRGFLGVAECFLDMSNSDRNILNAFIKNQLEMR